MAHRFEYWVRLYRTCRLSRSRCRLLPQVPSDSEGRRPDLPVEPLHRRRRHRRRRRALK